MLAFSGGFDCVWCSCGVLICCYGGVGCPACCFLVLCV